MDGWTSLESSALHEPEALAAVLADAARLDASAGSAALTPASALGAAVVSATGQLVYADPSFVAWFDQPLDSLDFRRLIKQAQKGGHAAGLVIARDGAAVAASVAPRGQADGWPLSELCRAALDDGTSRLVILAFAPSRASDLALRAADAFGLTPLEARLAEALLAAPTLHAAAARIGVGRETARDALRGAMKKAGAKRSPDLVRRMMDLMCGDQAPSADLQAVLRSAFGATPAEARAAARFAEGLTARQVASALGVKEATVRGQLKSVFAKTGVNKAKDLVRLSVETGALATLTSVSESVLEGPETGRLRIIRATGDRRIAFIDYGPRSGRPLIVPHGSSTGRTLPPRLLSLLHDAGWRPIVPQRPGFGLTDRADGDFLTTAADDMAGLLDVLKLGAVDLLARDASTAAALAFAHRYPQRVRRGVLVNPHAMFQDEGDRPSLQTAVMRTFASSPGLIETFAEMLRRQSRTDMVQSILRRSLAVVDSDRQALDDPRTLDQLVRDAQAQSARTSAGFATEHALYAAGWTPPATVGGADWAVLHGAPLGLVERVKRWAHLPGVTFHLHPQAGQLIYFTFPEAILELLGGP